MESCEHQGGALPEAVDEQQLEALFEPYGGVVGYRSMLRAALAKELEPVPLLNGGHKRVNVLQRNRILLRRAARARVRSCRIV
jgi:RNA recognition motif. (a.k.a. RRM, RBD, or RNP domain)